MNVNEFASTWCRKTRASLSTSTHITVDMNSDNDMQKQKELALKETSHKNPELD